MNHYDQRLNVHKDADFTADILKILVLVLVVLFWLWMFGWFTPREAQATNCDDHTWVRCCGMYDAGLILPPRCYERPGLQDCCPRSLATPTPEPCMSGTPEPQKTPEPIPTLSCQTKRQCISSMLRQRKSYNAVWHQLREECCKLPKVCP